jgi:WXG100 family type VII secretion target
MSSNDNIKVTTQDVVDLANGCVKTGTAVAGELNRLEARVKRVVDSSWVGQASSSFDGYFREFNQGQKKIEDALSDISRQLRGAAERYAQNEHDIAAQFGRR